MIRKLKIKLLKTQLLLAIMGNEFVEKETKRLAKEKLNKLLEEI